MKWIICSAAVALGLLSLSCGDPEPVSEEPAAVPGSSDLVLTVVDSVGAEMGDSTYMFGAIAGMSLRSDGSFSVMDRVMCNIRLFDEQGSHLRTISRPGEGPGELTNPLAFFAWRDGSFGVLDPWRGGIHRFSEDGEWLGIDLDVTMNVHLDPVVVGDSSFAALRVRENVGESDQPIVRMFIGLFPMTFEPTVEYWYEEVPFEPLEMANWALRVYFYLNWTADPVSGRVYVAPFREGEYVVRCLDSSGELIRELTLETLLIERDEFEIQVERDYVAQFLTSAEGGDPIYSVECEPWAYRLPVSEIRVDDAGNLWVLRGIEDTPRFDIWSPDGELIAAGELPGMENGDIRFRVGGGRMLLYYENPLDYQKIYLVEYEEELLASP